MQATDHLTSLVITYGRLVDQLEYYSYDIGRQNLVRLSLKRLEQKIKSAVRRYHLAKMDTAVIARRHSF